jgi:hypothetical protein
MDYEILRETLRITLDEVAFRKDETTGDNISIVHKSQEDLKAYLEENTSISDDEKAKYYSKFLTDIVTGVTIQAINVAGQAPLMDAQIDTLRAETAQKIISMQNEDKARMNDSAVNVAKAKADIESLIPAQVSKINAEIAALAKDAELKAKEIAIKEAELPLMQAQVLTEQQKVLAMQAETALKEAELPIREKQLEIETSKLELMEAEMEIKLKEIPLKEAQVKIAEQDVKLKEKQVELTGAEIKLKEKDQDLKEQELDNMRDMMGFERDKIMIALRELGLKTEETRGRLKLTEAQSRLTEQQADAVRDSLELQKEIEEARNEKDISVAEIYVGAKA